MLSRLVDIRPGEGKRALLACACLLLVIASYTMVKSVRDALFLSKFGLTQLSLIGIGLALAIGFIISMYLRFTAGVERNRLMLGTNAVVVSSLVLIWLGLITGTDFLDRLLPWVLYIWSSIFGVFLVMQFWLLAQRLFDPREAKRLFGVVGAGAILGGVSGGFLSRSLAGVLGAPNLLLVASVMLVVEVVLIFMVWPLRRTEEVKPGQEKKENKEDKEDKPKGGLSTLKENRVVRLLAFALLLGTVATTLLDFQFKGIVKDVLSKEPDPAAAMAGYFGTLYAGLSVASFLVQTVFTSGILRRFGVGVGLMLLPVSLAGGSALILFHTLIPLAGARLFSASAAKVAEGGLRFSIDKASMELMWLPVPPNIKERGKSFVDTVVDRLGTGLTGFIWLGLAAIGLDAPGKIHLVSIAVGVLVLVWLFILLGARGAYLGALRDAISQRRLDLDDSSLNLVDPNAVAPLRDMLVSGDPREALFALHMLEHYKGPLVELEMALDRGDPAVCREVLRFATRRQAPQYRQAAARCLTHEDDRVREAAVFYLHTTAPTGSDPLLEELADGDEVNPHIVDVIRLGVPAHAVAAVARIEKALAEQGDDEDDEDVARRLSMIRILGGAPADMAAALLAAPLTNDDLRVARTAIKAAGRAQAVRLIPQLCELLQHTRLRHSASAALRDMGSAAAEHLVKLLHDGQLSGPALRAAIRLLGSSGEAASVPPLVELLAKEDFNDTHNALRALVRLSKKIQAPLDGEQGELVRVRLDRELGTLYRDLLFLDRGSWADLREAPPPDDLLGAALAQRADDRMERIFHMVSLVRRDEDTYTPEDMGAAFGSVRSPLKSVRASSIEFLDNVLPGRFSQRLMPLLESAGSKRFHTAADQAGYTPVKRPELLRSLLDEQDTVLQAVAAWTVGTDGKEELRGAVAPLLANADPQVARVMQQALARLDSSTTEESKNMGMNAIEKALTLQKVDVLKRASTDDLVHIARIATEEELGADEPIYHEGDAPDALFVITGGKVRLHRDDEDIAVLGEGEAFGSWALVDESPRVASATTVDSTTLLRVSRDEFMELLADRVDIVQAVFKAMVERLRNLAALAKE